MTEFDDRFEELWAVGYRVAFAVLGDREEAADVAQDTLIRILSRWPDDPEAVAGLTARVAGQRAIDVWRRRRPAPVVPFSPWFPVEERDELVTALRRLSGRQQEVVILRYLAGLSERETAQAVGCAEGTVKQHATRGLASLRTTLGDGKAGG